MTTTIASNVLDHATDNNGHRYAVVSAHNTSEGRVAYLRCTCGLWRVQRYPRRGRVVLEAVVDAAVGAVQADGAVQSDGAVQKDAAASTVEPAEQMTAVAATADRP